MGEIEIGFVSSLKSEDPVTENLLTSLHNVQMPIGGIVEWNTLRVRDQHQVHFKMVSSVENQPRNQSTLTNVLMLAIMCKISGVNTRGGVCVYDVG